MKLIESAAIVMTVIALIAVGLWLSSSGFMTSTKATEQPAVLCRDEEALVVVDNKNLCVLKVLEHNE